MRDDAVFQTYVQTLLGNQITQAIWDRPNAPRPDRPFVTLRLDHTREFENAEYSEYTDANGNMLITTIQEVTISVECFSNVGGNAFDILTHLRTLSRRIENAQYCAPWSLFARGHVVNISALLDETMQEDRATMQFSFRCALQDVDNVGYIGTVNVSGVTGDLPTIVSVTED